MPDETEILELSRRIAQRVARRHDIPDYRELLGEAWLAVSACALRFDRAFGCSFKTYVHKKAPFVMVDSLRLETKDRRNKRALKGRTVQRLSKCGPTPATPDTTADVDRALDIDAAVEAVPHKRNREFVRLYRSGLTMRQIADKYGLSESAVSCAITGHRPFLRQLLADYAPPDRTTRRSSGRPRCREPSCAKHYGPLGKRIPSPCP